jgi:hypothetical protein
MARFYAVFDPTTGGAPTPPDTYHDKRYIGANGGTTSSLSASAALLRDGLIASRSALSSQMYSVMDNSNKDGAKGIIIPYDSMTFSGGNLNFSNVYTSSISGVVRPTNPSTRPPDAFISSSDPRLYATGDTGAIPQQYYVSAAEAINDLLRNKIQTAIGNTVNSGPYVRTPCSSIAFYGGPNARKDLSIFHSNDMSYFAWDDFQPGEPTLNPQGPYTAGAALPRGSQNTLTFRWDTQFSSDRYGSLYIFRARFIGPSPASTAYILSGSSGTGLEATSIDMSGGTTSFDVVIPANTLSAGNYKIEWTAYFRDAIYSGCTSPCTSTAGGYGPNDCEFTYNNNTYVTVNP